jgi:DNA-binding LacI/PurR family transcriptional regulator
MTSSGIDNRRAGFLITQHLLLHGVNRVAFIAKPLSASTVLARIAGYREALFAYGIPLQQNLVCRGVPDDPGFIQKVLKDCRPDAIVCANDFTARHESWQAWWAWYTRARGDAHRRYR